MRFTLAFAISCLFIVGIRAEVDLENEYQLSNRNANAQPGLEIERAWARAESVPDPFPESPSMSASEKEEAQLRRAYSFLEGARDLSQRMNAEIRDRPTKSISDPLWWKEMESTSSQLTRQHAIKQRYAIELAERFHRVFVSLSELDRAAFRQDPRVVSLRRQAYRQYIVIQSALGNYVPAMEILDDYGRAPESQAEWPMHYYYYVCLSGVFRELKRSSAVRQETLVAIIESRNTHWLTAVRQKYTTQSLEYVEVVSAIMREGCTVDLKTNPNAEKISCVIRSRGALRGQTGVRPLAIPLN